MEKYTEDQFWQTIEKMNWEADYNDERIWKELKKWKYGDKEYIKALFKFIQWKVEELETKWGNKITNVSDDSWSDLRYHIIWLWKDEYYRNLSDFKEIQARANRLNYEESFLYSFHEVDYVYNQ